MDRLLPGLLGLPICGYFLGPRALHFCLSGRFAISGPAGLALSVVFATSGPEGLLPLWPLAAHCSPSGFPLGGLP